MYVHVAMESFSVNKLHFEVGQIVYVGSGSIHRSKEKASRSKDHTIVFDKLIIQIIAKNLSQRDAFELEQLIISENLQYGLLNKLNKVSAKFDYKFELLSQYFYLDENLQLRWAADRFSGRKHSRKHISAGDVAGYSNDTPKKYATVCLNGQCLQLHRVIYCLYNKIDISSEFVIDHVNGNEKDNHPYNLELKTYSQNNLNRPSMKISKTGQRGICEENRRYTVAWYENKVRKTKRFNFSKYLKLGYSLEDSRLLSFSEAKEFNSKIRTEIYGNYDLN